MPDPVASSLVTGESATATTTVTFTAQAAGTLLVLCVVSDDYKTANPTGWSVAFNSPGSGEFHGYYMWYKKATGAETSVVYTIGSASRSVHALLAVSNIDGTTQLDIAASGQSANASAQTYTTPTSGTTTSGGRRIGLAMIGGSNSSALPTGVDTWLNSYTEVADKPSAATPGLEVGVASLVFDGGVTTSSGATYSGAWTPQSRSSIIAVFRNTAGSGSSFTSTPADSVGINDSAARVVSAARTQADPVGIADSVTANLSTAGSVTASPADPVGITDSVTIAVTYSRSLSDSVGIADTGSQQTLDLADTADDPVGISDAVSVVQSLARTVADAVGLTDSTSATTSATSSPSDPVGLTDAVTVVQMLDRAIADSVGIADSASSSLTAAGTTNQSDPLALTDQVATVVQADRSQTDAVGLTDALSLIVDRVVSEPLGIVDSVTVSLTTSSGTGTSDGVGIGDQTTVTLQVARTRSDGISVTDTVDAVLVVDTTGFRDVTVLAVTEITRDVEAVEVPRPVGIEQQARPFSAVVAEGGAVRLNRTSREFYTLTITTDPPVSGWEASFDGGTTWVAGEPTIRDANTWRWLVAGPAFVADATPASILAATSVPMLRAVDTPEVLVRRGPTITIER